ncbi:MAG: class II aldolase/adducin family protein [Elusimicrobia bacterium]|nr:class II aldolase/adducin family protein [Elusimicrobiota bacterium]MBK7688360.1 class II aldolase/adducin family protein [Elusimicrobiota bacterium]
MTNLNNQPAPSTPGPPLTISARLAQLSRRLGLDLLLSQGASGNTAVKQSGRMVIKATRTRLIDMTESTGWVEVDLARLHRDFETLWAGAAASENYLAALDASGPPGGRPSLETGLHALLPHPWTAHVHSLAGQILGRRPEEEIFARTSFLNGVAVRVIPAVPPGVALTAAVRDALQERPLTGDRCLLILRHHGLVWGGPSDTAVGEMSDAFEAEFRKAFRLSDFPPPESSATPPLANGWHRILFEGWPRSNLTETPNFFEFAEHFHPGENLRVVSPREAHVRALDPAELETHRQVLFAQALLGAQGTPGTP